MGKPYISEWIKEKLAGKTPQEAGLTDEDLIKLLNCYETGGAIEEVHLSIPALCVCNICRS